MVFVLLYLPLNPPLSVGIVLQQWNCLKPSSYNESILEFFEKGDNFTIHHSLSSLINYFKERGAFTAAFGQLTFISIFIFEGIYFV